MEKKNSAKTAFLENIKQATTDFISQIETTNIPSVLDKDCCTKINETTPIILQQQQHYFASDGIAIDKVSTDNDNSLEENEVLQDIIQNVAINVLPPTNDDVYKDFMDTIAPFDNEKILQLKPNKDQQILLSIWLPTIIEHMKALKASNGDRTVLDKLDDSFQYFLHG